jgi:phenylpropionate dioxygenase-like ring-hydroxylating dioxygenase large terminal subunit
LWRSDHGLHAWRDLCLHRGTRLSLGKVSNCRLICPYHGWQYNHEGRCAHIPAHPDQKPPDKARVDSFSVCEQDGIVWVSLGQPRTPPPSMPEWNQEEFRLIHCGPYTFEAAAPRVVENFLDVAHLAFVHDGLLGDSAHPELPDYDVETTEHGIRASNISIYQPDPDGTGIGNRVTYSYRVTRPFHTDLEKDTHPEKFLLFLGVCPHSHSQSTGFMIIAMNYGHDVPSETLRDFQDKIVAQDKPIVESQRPELLPLDLAEELHLRSDRTAIAYRKWLRELGLQFGTA